MYLGSKLYFERVEIFLWQFWHLCGCWEGKQWLHQQRLARLAWAGGGRGPRTVRRTQQRQAWPQRPEREREQLSVQPRQSASAEWPAVRQSVTISVTVSRALSRSHHTQLSLCHAWASEILPRPGEARSEVSTSEAREQSPYTCEWDQTLGVSSMWPPGLSTSDILLSLLSPQEKQRAGVGLWQLRVPVLCSLLAVTTHNR